MAKRRSNIKAHVLQVVDHESFESNGVFCIFSISLSIYILYLSRITVIVTFEMPMDNAGPIINIAKAENKNLIVPVYINVHK